MPFSQGAKTVFGCESANRRKSFSASSLHFCISLYQNYQKKLNQQVRICTCVHWSKYTTIFDWIILQPFFYLVPSIQETSFLTTFFGLYFNHHYTRITHYKSCWTFLLPLLQPSQARASKQAVIATH